MNLVIMGLKKRYRSNIALNGINMEIHPGIHGLLGSNGAGKTTLLRILATILRSDSGEIHWGETLDWKRPTAVKKALGYLPQQFGMYPYLSVREALRCVALLKGLPQQREREQIDLALERTHLADFQACKVAHLSGGMLRRLGIAQAILGEPDLLLLDEPSVGLDPEERIHLRKIIREYASSSRIVLLSSHIVGDIESLCDSLTILCGGNVLISGGTQEATLLADGWVREAAVEKSALDDWERRYTVVNFLPGESSYTVRYLDREKRAAGETVPTLEDSYALLVRAYKERERL